MLFPSKISSRQAFSIVQPLLLIPSHILHRPNINFDTFTTVVNQRKQHNTSIHHNAPIHDLRRRLWARREETHDQNEYQEKDGKGVNGEPIASETKSSIQQRLLTEAFQADTGYRDDVGGEEGADAE
jgi:hypothetical protein